MNISDFGLKSEDKIFDLIEKLDVRGPRYTSYPTAPVWKSDFPPEPYIEGLSRIGRSQKAVAIYLHLPYCRKRCLYCGCNAIISNRADRINRYSTAIIKEIEKISELTGGTVKHSWLHLGGGTPTHVPVDELASILDCLISNFPGIPNAERSIEVDPRVTTPDHLKMLRERNFRRISIGLQDFYADVQRAVHREYSYENMKKFVAECRSQGFTGVNIDLIYGLPLQTRESWAETLKKTDSLKPDRLVCFGYAHLPSKIKHQRAIDESQLPSPRERLGMLLDAQRYFSNAGYHVIGLDHFAQPEDELSVAQRAGKLWRNFMGYTDLFGLEMIGFGASAISEFEDLYVQNITSPDEYVKKIKEDKLPVSKGHQLDEDDRIRKYIINNLMCNLVVNVPQSVKHAENGLKNALESALSEVKNYEAMKLVKSRKKGEFAVTQLGQLFLRNIAMHFDRYLPDQTQVKFSRTV